MAEIRMVVGLGNPGREYADTRHNIGFRVIDSLGRCLGVDVKRKKFGACFGDGEFEGKKLILLKPWEYMNRSGQAVATAVGFYKLRLCDLLVVTDDMALPVGRIRMRGKGSGGGHNGLADIINKLGTGEFGRLRIGIGQSGPGGDVDFVLGRITAEERPVIDESVERAVGAVGCWVREGIDASMNEFNAE